MGSTVRKITIRKCGDNKSEKRKVTVYYFDGEKRAKKEVYRTKGAQE